MQKKYFYFKILFSILFFSLGYSQKTIQYKQVDTTHLSLTIYEPENIELNKKYPAMIFFHGGGWVDADIRHFEPQAKYFSKRGIICILAEYRVKNIHQTTPFESLKDAKSAIRFIRENSESLNIESSKIIAAGGSAGGHLAAATALIENYNEITDNLTTSCIPNALVLFNPVIDNGPGGFGYSIIGEEYESFSPLHNIKQGAPPTVIFLGTEDELVPVETAQLYKNLMELEGSRCDLHLYEGQGHSFFNYNNFEYYEATVSEADDFLQSLGYLGEKPIFPKVNFTSVPSSTQVGTNLVVNYKYSTPTSGGKVAISISKNGGDFAYTYISSVAYAQLTPTTAGTDVPGSFSVLIPLNTVPTSNLTGNQNYRIKIELRDANNSFLAGDYDTINYNFTPATIAPQISFTSVPPSTQIGTNLVVSYKYSNPNAGGKVAVSVTKNGGAFPYTYINSVAYRELTPTVSGTNIIGTFTIPIPAQTIPTASLTGNENYRIKIEIRDAANGFLAGNYENINYNFTALNFNYYVDKDGDGYGAGSVISLTSSIAPSGYSINNGDCDDTKDTVFPSATEVFDTIDNDCDGLVDEDTELPSSLTFCKGATVATAKGTTDLQLYTSTSPTALPLSANIALSPKVYYATLNGSTRTAVTVTVNNLPSTPTTISTTDALLCKHIGTTNEVTYSVPAVVGITNYSWSLPAGVTATSATDTNAITVNFENASTITAIGGIGTISARAISAAGCISAPRALILTSKLPTSPTTLTMTSLDTNANFNFGIPSVPTSLSQLEKITKVGAYMGTDIVFTLTALTGLTPAPTAASYAWTLPAGVNQLSGGTSNVITVDFAGVTPGIGLLPIAVRSVGGCGQSATPRTLNLARALPTAPTALILTDDAISSTTPVTKVGAYTGKTTPLTLRATPAMVQGATATSYAWILPSGVNIVSPVTTTATTISVIENQGTVEVPNLVTVSYAALSTGTASTITVNFAGVAQGTLSFPLTVFAVNGTGNSKARTRTVTAAAPTSSAITAVGGTTFNSCTIKTYSVVQTLGTSYTWTIPAGATASSLTGNTIVVDYTNVEASVGATVQVTCTASNGTGSSLAKVLNVKRVICPVRLADSSANDFSVKAYPNPSSSEFTIETSAKGAMSVKVYDMQGRLVEKSNTEKVGSRLAAGAYNVIVNQGTNTKSVRVIKK